VTLRAKTASGFYYSFGSDLFKKHATDFRLLSPAGSPTGVHDWLLLQNWVAIPQGTLPRERTFVIFGHFPSDKDAMLLCSVSICSICCIHTVYWILAASKGWIKLYSSGLVIDSLRIVEFLRI